MFKAICGLIFAVVVRILIEYLSRQFTFLVSWVPWHRGCGVRRDPDGGEDHRRDRKTCAGTERK